MAGAVFYTDENFRGLSVRLERYNGVAVLTDSKTEKFCYPLLFPLLPQTHELISIPAGEENKNLKSCERIWRNLTSTNADRKILLINLGGGVICDMGGFAAACYKRGIAYINMPTTLLAMTDASIGGKTGIDFMGFKNQIGVFAAPEAIFIYPGFLSTLPRRELLSGFAEVIKHYLIADKNAFEAMVRSRNPLAPEGMEAIIKKNIRIKQQIVSRDVYEKGPRQALNFGHTTGHALESLFLKSGNGKLLHGEAVAGGMLAESFISFKTGKLARGDLKKISRLILRWFTLPRLSRAMIPEILRLIKQDKKNSAGSNRFTLLEGIGRSSTGNTVGEDIIVQALEYYNSQLG